MAERSSRRRRRHSKRVGKISAPKDKYTPDTRPDWSRKCETCGQTPVVPSTGMCGPCTFGESETADGNW
jgi:hypothetical protein